MSNVVFVAPFLAETTLRFVDAAASLPAVAVHLVSQDPPERVPDALRAKVAAHHQVRDGIDPAQLSPVIESIQRRGPIHRLLGTLEQLQVPLGELRDQLNIPGMGAEVARRFRDKALMKDVLRAANVPCARHALATSAAEAQRLAEDIGYPLIIKPPAGAGAHGTHRVENEEQLGDCVRMMPPSPARPALLEEFMTGEELSFDSMVINGRMVWHGVNRYFPTPLQVLEQPWIQWCVLSPREVDAPEWEEIGQVARRALGALGLDTGITHLEWFRREDGSVAVSEVAARPPGAQFTTLHSWAGDFDLYRAWASGVVLGEFPTKARPFAAGAAFVRGQGEGRVKSISGIEEVNRELGGLVVESRLPQPGQAPTGTYEGEGYVILRHPRTEVVRDGLLRLIRLIRVELG